MSRIALVTGGSGGIGAAIVRSLAEPGHRIGVCFAGDEAGAAKAVAAAEEAGGEAVPVQVDVADAASVDAAFAAIEEAFGGKVELLVNNAGITRDGLFLRMDDDQWRDVLRTNLDGAFHCIRRAAPGMVRARYGRIVNVSSVAGLSGSAGQANYAAAKAGLVGLTRSVARELSSRKVTCNVVAPGPIETAMTAALSEERRAELTGQVPLGRMGNPEEVAAAVAFLCSDQAAYITGAVVPVDGGLGMGH